MSVDIVTQAGEVLAGAFLARAVYGGEFIDAAFNVGGDNDAELADDYRGYLASQGPGQWQLLSAADLPTFNNLGGDVDGNGTADFEVALATLINLVAADFIL